MTDAEQTPDTKPGGYYVTMVRDGRVAYLVGPFINDHAAALRAVEPARIAAAKIDPFADFDLFGTARLDFEHCRPGALNAAFGLPQ